MAPMPPGPIGDLVVDVGGGHHRPWRFDARLVLDATEDSPLAGGELSADGGVHSKTSWRRIDEGVKYLDCSPEPGGFRVFSSEGSWDYAWLRTNDGLPLIRETAERQFAAMGFSGNGMTFGALAAMMACDAARGKRHPWRDLLDVHRKKLGSTWDDIRENLDYPYYMIKVRFSSAERKTTRGLKPGGGKILALKGRRLAAYRDPKGNVATLSPVCSHLGCLVSWNAAKSTWNCPSHGSRFKPAGQVLARPAESPLEPVSLDEE